MTPRMAATRSALVAVLVGAVGLAGCQVVAAVGIRFFYKHAALPDANVRLDLPYVEGPGADAEKHRLNLFLPLDDSVRARPWPTVIFVHGGGWNTGDKDFAFGGQDLYNNVGRFFAQRGVGAVTVNYRLLRGVAWPGQIADVAKAVAWVHRHVAEYGGDPDALFVMGHSAGGQLAARVALDPEPLGREGLDASVLCGAISVSGAGLDLTDRETYLLEDNFDYYSARFSPDGVPVAEPPERPFAWQAEASPIRFVRSDAPPFLLIYAGGETEALQRQSRLLDEALRAAGAESRIVVVPGRSHERIVPTLSRDDQTAGPAMVAFVRAQRCG